MLEKRTLLHRVVLLALVLILAVPLLVACGGDNQKTPTPTPTPRLTLTLTPTPTATSTVTPFGPVKIGIIAPWSGPGAMTGIALVDPVVKLVEQQVKDQGGILGGREVKLIKYDNRMAVAESTAGAIKLILDNKVSALALGGNSRGELDAVVAVAEEKHVFFAALGYVTGLANLKFTVNAGTTLESFSDAQILAATKLVKAKTAAILATDVGDMHELASINKRQMQEAGIELVYEQYTPLATNDYTPFLTKIKFEKPDVLFLDESNIETNVTIAKQIMELGGWDNIKVLAIPGGANAAKLPGADGWYIAARWYPGLPYPGAMKLEKDYQSMFGSLPSANLVYFYDPIWTVIKAIELAGTDTDLEKIAQVARSGNLEWETPEGHAHFTPDGVSGLVMNLALIEGKKLVSVTIPE